MPTTADLLVFARDHASELETEMRLVQPATGGERWKANNPASEDRIRARAITALAFLDQYTEAGSQWATRAHEVFDDHRRSVASRAHALGEVLRAWVGQVEAGIVSVPQVEAQGLRAIASTDLMEQVRKLLDDRTVHPAAPIVLAGAALELALRSALVESGLELPTDQRPSINAYKDCLRAANVITRQDAKDIDSMGGMRNDAAHGHFDDLSRERAALMEQQVNLLLRRIADLLTSQPV